ncbi:hypothetical protein BaRGS_00004594 [Batillaria attramentaria]|uniref:Uncharacterized protein n=1 Tax=Batillaria attramentaria TaxID=370345 RepID=A0ABD0LXC3_9CAEN
MTKYDKPTTLVKGRNSGNSVFHDPGHVAQWDSSNALARLSRHLLHSSRDRLGCIRFACFIVAEESLLQEHGMPVLDTALFLGTVMFIVIQISTT